MDVIKTILWWFAGGINHPYHTLSHCMHQDWFVMGITVTLDLLVASGYVVIAYHWSKNEKTLPASPAKTALRMIRNIFVLCGICGYLFIPIEMFWPAWRLYDVFMVALVTYTWRYALNAKNFKVIYTAIGESKQLAEDLAKSVDESKRKSFFLNAISHDLRTPLNGMLLHTNLAELHIAGDDASSAQTSLNEIKTSIKATVEMLEGLLDFARLEAQGEAVELVEVDVAEVVDEVVRIQQGHAEAKLLVLSGQVSAGLTLLTNRTRLERILNNLVSNAIKFTDAGSVTVHADSTAGDVRICVADTGIGIAVEEQGRLFEEFYQVQNHERDSQKGFGLGLAICDRLVKQLNGRIGLESRAGNGSRFTVVFPGGNLRQQNGHNGRFAGVIPAVVAD